MVFSGDEHLLHIPVMLDEVISFIKPRKGDIIVDATVGAGGHSREILKMIGTDGLLIGIDRDAEILKIASKNLSKISKSFKLYHANYVDLSAILNELKISRVNGILLDLGVSTFQLNSDERGFSFIREGPLDMRMDRSKGITAEDLLKQLPEKDMEEIFWRYGEERWSRNISRTISRERRKGGGIKTTTQLAKIIEKAVYTPRRHMKRRRIHPATRVFQALRIVVNDELKNLEYFLNNAHEFLLRGSRIVVISFHSLEDRLAKNAFRKGKNTSTLKILTNKPLRPIKSEIKKNIRCRSAKLRAAERI
jgi:16S rRNA (cytosine1402-N4)-methyltransferase